METKRYVTFGKICCRLQIPPGWVEAALRDLHIEAELVFDDLSYFSESVIETIKGHYLQKEIDRLENEKRKQNGKAN